MEMKRKELFLKRLKFLPLIILCPLFFACSDDDEGGEDNGGGTPYITKVFEFRPAVGQFTNDLPEYEEGDTEETMRRKAEDLIKGANPKGMVSLGGFGGYIVFGFDHMVKNVSGKRDFRVKGNAFYADDNPNEGASKKGGNCEPGIIMVSHDKNGNGLPDDEWYEIAGSEYNNPRAIKNYRITYYRPDPDKEPVKNPSKKWALDTEYIRWEDNQGNSGYKVQNIYHEQSYYPGWIQDDKITFEGTRLPDNAVEESGKTTYWVLYAFDWGYADNAPNDSEDSAIDIDWAVDKNGNKVKLPGIHFVKVYCAINQEAGWIGETSTEIAGAEDLHLINK